MTATRAGGDDGGIVRLRLDLLHQPRATARFPMASALLIHSVIVNAGYSCRAGDRRTSPRRVDVPFFAYFLPLFLAGHFLRLILAKSRSCFSLTDFAICFEAPFSDDLDRFPRLAARAAPGGHLLFL
jgi:hypothetical protein